MKRWMIGLFGLMAAFTAPATAAQDQTRWLDRAALDQYLEDAAHKGFQGQVALSDARGTFYVRVFGDAVSGKQPYDDGTLIDIASISKQFTGAAILKLLEAGKLAPTDRLDRFFPDVPADKAAISLHQLLTHTAGLPDTIGRDEERIGRADFLKQLFAAPLIHAPGGAYAYSNAGYSLLAAVIETVSGQPYEDYLFENLWRPAGMLHTGYYRPDWSGHTAPEVSVPVADLRSQKALLEHGQGQIWNLMGNGGLLSTVADMMRWHRALLGNDILNEASKKLLFSRHVPEDEAGYFYGYGWSVVPDFHAEPLVWHNGGSYFSRAEYWRLPKSGMAILVATHESPVKPYFVADGIAALMRGETPKPLKP